MSSFEEKEILYSKVMRLACRDCGNVWWFDEATSWVCTKCLKTHGKDSSWTNQELKDLHDSEKCL